MIDKENIPYCEIQELVSSCNDPQMPFCVRQSAKIVQAWLDGKSEKNGMDDE